MKDSNVISYQFREKEDPTIARIREVFELSDCKRSATCILKENLSFNQCQCLKQAQKAQKLLEFLR